ncbi:uncharacterized protein HGUI_01452 [Hanseniaspora guilliermondii]|uniref:chitinase n=1 Tax=Hanseniaspora guilliermondii TaxID=56406 RepID=A0A1L0B0C8_9ASCO|nr:uncharacterized protein HGUI_01452 [Hanseniaspora guilliermondii]
MINHLLSVALIAAALSQTSFAVANTTSNNQIALYWGVNSNNEKSLSYYCQKQEADIILLSFLDSFPTMNLDLNDNCQSDFSNTSSVCSTLESDIKTCQDLGVTVMLSLGGEDGSYGFTNTSEAKDFANTLWNTFAEGNADYRPFGSAIIDGFDFDIENNLDTGYTTLVNELRSIANEKGSKYYYISAAPQCVYPDAGTGDMLLNSYVDFAFIQFYNNYCNLGSANFNWDTWKDYAEEKSPNSNIKLFLGLPGSASAASTGYQSDLSVVDTAVKNLHSDSNFGGIMLWDAAYGYSNIVNGKSYVEQMKNILDKYSNYTSKTTSSIASVSSITIKTSSYLSSKDYTSSSTSITSSTKISTKPTSTLAPRINASTVIVTATPSSSAHSSVISTKSLSEQPSSETKASNRETTTLRPSVNSSTVVVTATPSSSLHSTTSTRNWDEPLTTETITLPNGQVTTSHIWWLPETTTSGTHTGKNWNEPVTTETITLPNGQVTTSHIWWLPETTTSQTTPTGNSTSGSKTTKNWNEPVTTETVTLPNGQVTTTHIWWLPETTVYTGSQSTKNWNEPVTTETVTLPNGKVTTTHIWWLPETVVA